MKQLSIYLTFPGNCEEALNFYKKCLKGEIVSMQRFSQVPGDPNANSETWKDKIMHSEFRAEDVYFMASDGMEGMAVTPGDNITININLDSEQEQKDIFNSLSEGGRVNMPLQDTFWGACFGMLTDKYGINWMLNRNLAQPANG